MTSADPVRVAAEAYIIRCLQRLRERCPAEGDTETELGFPRWIEGEGVISQVGQFRSFRLMPDIWEPGRVCAVRELALMTLSTDAISVPF
jgi:hypothetical protein